jgi:hypothetical protein
VPTARTVRLANAAPLVIQGIKAGYHGQRVLFQAQTSFQVDFPNNSPAAAAPDRLLNVVTSAPTSILHPAGRGWAEYEYDGSGQAWRLISHEQGGYISPPFNAGDYFAAGPMTWAVTAGQVPRCAYKLSGRSLTVDLGTSGSTFGGTASNQAFRTVPGGYTAAAGMNAPIGGGDAAGAFASALWGASGGNLIFLKTFTGAPFALGPGVAFYAVMTFEVN